MNDKIWLSPPHLSGEEIALLQTALQENWISTTGPQVKTFEEELSRISQSTFSLATSSGTSALHLALLAIGVQPDDYVICPSFTFAASAFPILYCGAKPVFVDSDPLTWNIDLELLESCIKTLISHGKKPAAIILVHIYGNPCEMKGIVNLAKEYDIKIVEDAAESLGSFYDKRITGSFGDCGVYSFNGNKIVTTGGGGALVTADEILYTRAALLANQSNSGVDFYQHKEVGFNYRLSNILASIGISQLKVLNERVKQRRDLFQYYRENINIEVTYQAELPIAVSNRWLTCLKLPNHQDRDRVFQALKKNNIDCRYLMKPLHLQPVFSDCSYYSKGVADDLFQTGLCIPSGSSLSMEDRQKICDVINNANC